MKRISQLFAISFAVISSSASIADDFKAKPYIGISYGKFAGDKAPPIGKDWSCFACKIKYNHLMEDDEEVPRLIAGYQFSPHYAVEMTYGNGRSAINTMVQNYTWNSIFNSTTVTRQETRLTFLKVALIGELPINNWLSAVGSFGGYNFQSSTKESISFTDIDYESNTYGEQHGTFLSVGVGAVANLWSGFKIRGNIEWTGQNKAVPEIAVLYQF